jgi:hypothetical protein
VNGRVRVLKATVDASRASLGAYTPVAKSVTDSLDAIVVRLAKETAPDMLVPAGDERAELELRTTFVRVEPDTPERPFATVQLVVEVVRRATGQLVYTRKSETETRRLLQPPVPLDDPRFERTALGRAALSCLRSVFSGLQETFVAA